MKTRAVQLSLFALLFLVTLTVTPAIAQPPRTGWFVGGSLSAFEFAGTGKVVTLNGDIDFDVESQSAYGLILSDAISRDQGIGFGWTNSQLPGGKLLIGYRHGFHWVTHLDLFWALPKSEQLQGYAPENQTGVTYLDQQSTRFELKSTRLLWDWRPFEPLPLWFFTFGVEYVQFSSRLEFRWQTEYSDHTQRFYEAYEDDGSAFGGVIGTGLQFDGNRTDRTEWYVSFTYSYSPFNDPFFAWDGDFLVGGMALEAGTRVFIGRYR